MADEVEYIREGVLNILRSIICVKIYTNIPETCDTNYDWIVPEVIAMNLDGGSVVLDKRFVYGYSVPVFLLSGEPSKWMLEAFAEYVAMSFLAHARIGGDSFFVARPSIDENLVVTIAWGERKKEFTWLTQ